MKKTLPFLFALYLVVGLCTTFNFAWAQPATGPATYIRVSPRDARYLEYSDGRPYIPIGLNMIGVGNTSTEKGMALMQDWIQQLAQNQGNFIRLWFSDSFWEVEHQKSGVYDEEKARERLDKILELATQFNIRVKATLEHFRNFNNPPQWSSKPWHDIKNGGTASSVEDFFRGAASQEVFRKKLDWYAARYGANSTIFAWELWNEVNATQGGGYTLKEVSEQYDWTILMLRELRQRFPMRLATQSLGSFDDVRVRETYEAFCRIPGNDLAQVHRYLDLGAQLEICHQPVDVLAVDAVKELRAFNLNKPVLLAESGAVEPRHAGPFKLYGTDKAGIILHDVLFAPFFAGAAGGGQIWHWNDYVAKNKLWYHFARFAETVKDLDPPAESFVPVEETQKQLRIFGLKGKNTRLLWCRDTRNTWMTELQQGQVPEVVMGFKLNLRNFLNKNKPNKISIYDPWANKWRVGKLKKGGVPLPAFTRSIVVKIEYP